MRHHRQECHRLHRETVRLEHEALELFAALNGWKTTDKAFAVDDIGTHRRRLLLHSVEIFDHLHFFRDQSGRNAALVTQPYNDHLTEAAALAAEAGLALHVPPCPRASFWYPGQTYFLLFTAIGHEVRWLPEQEVASWAR